MCTLSFIAAENGYRLAMNRDERIARGAGTVPQQLALDGTRVVFPGDGADGTWVGVNEYGIALALLNWNEPSPPAGTDFQSRGRLIPAIINSRSLAELEAGIRLLDRLRPFRMAGVFPAEQSVREWRWDGRGLEALRHSWESRHWFSCGLSDEQARLVRGEICAEEWKKPDSGSSAWLRTLHASHTGGSVFGMCVHRDDVQTLSFTEIHCTAEKIAIEHFLGSPCLMKNRTFLELPRLTSPIADRVTPMQSLPSL